MIKFCQGNYSVGSNCEDTEQLPVRKQKLQQEDNSMKKNTTNDMTSGNCMRLLVQFFLPILAGNLFQQFYSFADSMVVGKGIGDTALAAVGNTSSVHFLIIGFAIGLTGGLGICISQSFGAGNYEKLREEVAMSVWICLIIGIVITVGSLATMRQLFVFLRTPEDMMTETIQYFGAILAGSTVTIFNNFAMTLLRSVGNSRVPLIAMVISAIVNILLDLVFVFPLHMGVFGAAFATVLAQVLSMLYCFSYIWKAKELIPKKADWLPQGTIIKVLTLKGLPVAVMNSVTAVGGMVLQSFVNGMGTGYVAAYAACTKILSLFEQPANTVGLALLTFVGQNYGAGKYDRIRTGIRDGIFLTILVSLPLALMQILIPEVLTSFMLNEATVIAHTREFLTVTGVCLFPLGWLFVFRNGCQGMGHTVIPMLSGVLEVTLRVVMVKILVPYLAFRGVALAEVSAWIGAWIMLMITYKIYQLRMDSLR